VKVVSYNILNDHPRFGDSAHAWHRRRPHLLARVQWHAPDVLGIQEGTLSQMADLRAALPDLDACGESAAPHGNGEFCAIFYRRSRFALLGHETFWLTPTPSVQGTAWGARHHRICTVARLRDQGTGGVLIVANTHLDHTSPEARQNGATLIAARLRALSEAHPEAATVLVGDFNAAPDSPAAARLSEGCSLRPEPLGPAGPAHTFTGLDAGWSWRRLGLHLRYSRFMHRQLDHIWLSARWSVARVWADRHTVGGRYPSDHLPVVLEAEPLNNLSHPPPGPRPAR